MCKPARTIFGRRFTVFVFFPTLLNDNLSFMNIELKLEGQEMYNAQIELLIKILATQKATATTLVEMIAKSDQEAEEFISLLNDEADKYAKTILRSLYERRGKIDLNDILGGK
jgi:hypothetical protein